jgi:Fe-S cluster biogenesis protein NfuA
MKTEDMIQKILDEDVNPILSAHFGGAYLVNYENNIARVKMTGACAACPSAQLTVEGIVKKIVTEKCGEVKDVTLDTSASDEMLEMAKEFMKKE